MASKLIGRTACPECAFPSAHVKIKEDKENAHPYRHCPECGAQYFPRNKQQAAQLLEKVRPEANTPPAKKPDEGEPGRPGQGPATPAPAAVKQPTPAPAPAPARKGFLAGVFDDD